MLQTNIYTRSIDYYTAFSHTIFCHFNYFNYICPQIKGGCLDSYYAYLASTSML